MAPRQRVNLAQFRQQVRNQLQQSPFWTDAELNANINESLRTWNCLTGQWKRPVTITTQQNRPYYSLAGLLVFGMRVQFGSLPLAQSSLTNWDKESPQWEGRPSASGPDEWAPVGISIIAIKPADAVGNRTLTINGVAATPILTTDADFIDIGEEEFDSLLNYNQYLAVFKCGGAEFESCLPLYQSFLKAAASKNERLNASNLFRRAMGIDNDQAGMRPRRAPALMQPVGER
jgi:hypothetical protein